MKPNVLSPAEAQEKTWRVCFFGQAAYGKDGGPTKALAGFAAKNGVDVGSVRTEADAKGVEYIWALRRQAGRPAAEVRAHALCFVRQITRRPCPPERRLTTPIAP